MDAVTLVLAVTAISGLYMAWNIGANDVANAMGTSVGSGALTLRTALVVAAVFELGGAMLGGSEVAETIADGIVRIDGLEPIVVAAGMASSLIAAAAWIHFATYAGWPVSTTHSIVGAVLGFGLVAGGPSIIEWAVLGRIAASWLISPALGGLGAYLLFLSLKKRVLHATDPNRALRRGGPIFVFVIVTVIVTWLLTEARPLLAVDLDLFPAMAWAVLAGCAAGFATRAVMVTRGEGDHERLFAVLQVVTACFVAFAHGTNDVANAVGPIGAAFTALELGVTEELRVPPNVLLLGACGIVLGLATYGFRVMATIGREITQLTPSRGFAAELAAATTIVVASTLGLPVSTTNVLVGAVVGVGLTRSLGAINLRVLRGIGTSWVLTVPASAAGAAILTALATVLLGR